MAKGLSRGLNERKEKVYGIAHSSQEETLVVLRTLSTHCLYPHGERRYDNQHGEGHAEGLISEDGHEHNV